MNADNPIEMSKKRWRSVIASTVTALTIIGGLIGIYSFSKNYSGYDLTGEWAITNTIESTTYRPFMGFRLGYRVFLTQHGTDITGTGEKVSENDNSLPSSAHTHISISGAIKGKRVSATFQEEGTRRKTEGTLDWTYQPQTKTLLGTFKGTAAEASGRSTGQKVAH